MAGMAGIGSLRRQTQTAPEGREKGIADRLGASARREKARLKGTVRRNRDHKVEVVHMERVARTR